MKKRIAHWLLGIARRLDPQKVYDIKEHYEARTLGIGYHIGKNDLRKYRQQHPEIKSHRRALDELIKDTKGIILGNIAAGIREKQLIEYTVERGLWTADVAGTLNVYVKEEDGAIANES